MIIDERSYLCHPGRVADFLKIYETRAKPIQWPILGEPIGFFVTEVGTINTVVHLWRYESMGEREKLRAQLQAAPGWQDYVRDAGAFLQKMENRILVPTSFSPMR